LHLLFSSSFYSKVGCKSVTGHYIEMNNANNGGTVCIIQQGAPVVCL
jgi:hypothetical protein